MDPKDFLFWFIASLTGLSAIAVVVTQNIVRSATWLLFTLAGTSAIFFLLGADLVGAVQLLVYVGGTLILVVFGVMLTAQGPFISLKTSAAEWAMSIVVGLLLFGVLAVTTATARWAETHPQDTDPQKLTDLANPTLTTNSVRIGRSLLGEPIGPSGQSGQKSVRTSYLLPFEIVSVHLLVVLIGAAYLARAKRRRGAAADAATDVR